MAIKDIDMEHTTVKIPKTPEEAESLKKILWACETTKILDSQKIPWSLFYGGKNTSMVDSFNYGDGVLFDHSINKQYTMRGKIFTAEMLGKEIYTDVILQKGNIKFMVHRDGMNVIDEELGDVMLKINSFIYLNFNKYSGYIRFQNIGKNVISITLHIDDNVIDLYGDSWEAKLEDVYLGKAWK